MTEPHYESELPSADAPQQRFRPAQAFRSFAGSFLINGLCPYLLYTFLEPHFPVGAVQPLLWASIFPAFGLVFGIVRKRMVDMVAMLVLLGMSINIAAIFLTPTIRWALVARSLNGLATATVLLISALIGKPIFYYVARQFITANDPARVKGFDAANVADGRRTFVIITLIWAIGIYCVCALNVVLALNLAPANYLLASQITTMTLIVCLTVWTIRFARSRLATRRSPER